MDTNNETLISLLAVRELQIKELHTYIMQLEQNLQELSIKYNELASMYYAKKKRIETKIRNPIGYKIGGNK